jgi:hypothetical protein
MNWKQKSHRRIPTNMPQQETITLYKHKKRSYRTGIKTHLYSMYFMTASATTDAERAPNPRFPERHTPSTANAKQAAEQKDLERRQRQEEEEEESRRGFAASERCVGERGERGRFWK